MIGTKNILPSIFDKLLSETTQQKVEKLILYVAIASFLIHLLIIYVIKLNGSVFLQDSELFENPISAIYTPFSFILIYEVYLLIYYLPRSFTTYITKQYEIITLIIIRKLFKDLASLELSTDWFNIGGDVQFTYDLLASLLLFYLIFQFQKQGKLKFQKQQSINLNIANFVEKKKMIAVILVPLFFIMAFYTLINWLNGFSIDSNMVPSFDTINNLFFDQFFTILILVDVILLLISFFYTDKFHKIIRNSGFVVSTILIRMSFSTTGLISNILIVSAVVYGLIIILIHNEYEKNSLKNGE
ncbi:MAG: hypothetical protein HN487_10915 [Flavobacterium sp.]|jgi:hypothetical protein|nr:hypothetical protein [Flavobacterium sp.]